MLKLKSRTRSIFFPAILFFASLFFTSSAYCESDFGLWLEGGIRYRIDKRFRLEFDQHLRMKDNVTRVETIMPEFSVRYKPLGFLSLKTGYRFIAKIEYIASEPYTDIWHRLFASAELSKSFKPITLSYRFMFQETFGRPRFEIGAKYKHTFRHRAGIEYGAWKKFKPFLDLELFMRAADNDGVLHKWRISPGLEYRFKREHRFTLYYLFEDMLNGANDVYNVTGIAYHYYF